MDSAGQVFACLVMHLLEGVSWQDDGTVWGSDPCEAATSANINNSLRSSAVEPQGRGFKSRRRHQGHIITNAYYLPACPKIVLQAWTVGTPRGAQRGRQQRHGDAPPTREGDQPQACSVAGQRIDTPSRGTNPNRKHPHEPNPPRRHQNRTTGSQRNPETNQGQNSARQSLRPNHRPSTERSNGKGNYRYGKSCPNIGAVIPARLPVANGQTKSFKNVTHFSRCREAVATRKRTPSKRSRDS